MRLHQPNADLFVPDEAPLPAALARTTHLCIAAHPDDQEFMAFQGISECYGRKDRRFCGVVVTDGRGSPRSGLYAHYSDERMAAVRRLEQRRAAYLGDYGCQIQLAYSSAAVKAAPSPDVVDDLRRILDAARPATVYLHNPADKHDTHVAVCLRAIEALRALPPERRPARVLGCEIWRDLDWLDDADKQVLPADRLQHLAAALAGVFDSQISGGKRYDLAAAGRRLAHATFYESHGTDATDAINFAMDLTPLVADAGLDTAAYTTGFIRRFEQDVLDRIRRFSPGA